jgi:aminopeptidase 2
MSREILPDNLCFTHYSIDITPNFNTFKFKGKEAIVFFVARDTTIVTLNAKDLVITSVCICYDGEVQHPDMFTYNTETVDIQLVNKLTPKIGLTGTMFIEYLGVINDNLKGFYKTKYTVKKSEKGKNGEHGDDRENGDDRATRTLGNSFRWYDTI